MNKASIPERLYYPLPEAAENLGCSVKDIIHMGATGALQLSVFIPKWSEHENGKVNIFFAGLYDDLERFSIDDYTGLRGDGWSISGVYKVPVNEEIDSDTDSFSARYLNGFFDVDHNSLVEYEFDLENEFLRLHTLHASENHEGYGPITIHSYSGFNFQSKYLCVMSVNIGKVGHSNSSLPMTEIEKPEKKYNENKQSKMIKALIEIHYGFGASGKARSMLNTERNTGEMLADFDRAGIRAPVSGKVLAEWIKDTELEYVDISTVKSETSKK